MFFDGMGFVRCVAGDILRHERQLKKATDKSEIFGLTLLYSAILLPGRMKLNTANVSNLQPLTFSTWFCRLSEAFVYICIIMKKKKKYNSEEEENMAHILHDPVVGYNEAPSADVETTSCFPKPPGRVSVQELNKMLDIAEKNIEAGKIISHEDVLRMSAKW